MGVRVIFRLGGVPSKNHDYSFTASSKLLTDPLYEQYPDLLRGDFSAGSST